MQTLEEAQEESGWKLVHGDVFRPPSSHPMLLAVLAGSGVQVGPPLFSLFCASDFFDLETHMPLMMQLQSSATNHL